MPCSDHVAAVGTDYLADHEFRILAGEKKRSGCDIARLAEAADRRDRFYLLAHLGVDDRGHRSIDEAGRDAIDEDSHRDYFARNRLGERDDSAFRGAVIGCKGETGGAGDRAKIDDATGLFGEHHL